VNDAWTDWQREHAAALAALQDAQRAYHRIAVASPQSTVGSRQSAVDSREGALEALDAARVRLDDVRARMPR
jgi:hypothetical protein